MKKFILFSLFMFSAAFAGVINVAAKNTISANLTEIDSITFNGKNENKIMTFSGKAKLTDVNLADLEYINFTLKSNSKEKMTVVISDGLFKGEKNYKLSDVKNIEIESVDNESDMDSDGLSDIDEIYKYGTNPKSPDTDGDGWSDKDELADGMYNYENPTVWNAKIADVPSLKISMTKTPIITLNLTTSTGTSISKSITDGSETSSSVANTYESSRSSDLENAWSVSTSHQWEVGTSESKYTGGFEIGYNGSYTSSESQTWGTETQKSIAKSYEKSVSEEEAKGSEISGATLCMQVSLKNTGAIAYTIEALKLSASVYDLRDTGTLKIIADLDRELGWTSTTLKVNESVSANFCNENVSLEKIENLINSPGALVLGTSSQQVKLTINGTETDFTEAYTNVSAKTSDIIIDYGFGNKATDRYQVATNYLYNQDHEGSDDMYKKVSLAELLKIANVSFEQDSLITPNGKRFGIKSINDYSFNLADSAWWFVAVQKAIDIKTENNKMSLYSVRIGNSDLNNIVISAGDAVQIFYSKDVDGDGLPVRTENTLGTSDSLIDSDSDGLTDYEEVNGWTRIDSLGNVKTFYTNPANIDTDGDGVNDKEDENPNIRKLFTSAEIDGFNIYKENLVNVDNLVWETSSEAFLSSTISPNDSQEIDVGIAPRITFKFKTKETVRNVVVKQYSAKNETSTNKYIVPDSSGEYVYTTMNLSVNKPDIVTISVQSEDEVTTNNYNFVVKSKLMAPIDFNLGRNEDRNRIIVNYSAPKDPRIEGYEILRSKDENSLSGYNINPSTTLDNESEKDGISFINNGDALLYSDSDKGGAGTFYYKVYAYTKENGTYYFSNSTNYAWKNIGSIKVKMYLKAYAGEYLYENACRMDGRVKETLYEGNTSGRLLYEFNNYEKNIGSISHANTLNWASVSSESDEYIIGKDGLSLKFTATYDCNSTAHTVTKEINWPYSAMAEVLLGKKLNSATGVSGEAPKKGNKIMSYIFGSSNILLTSNEDVYSGVAKSNDTCNDTYSCGDEPHAGAKFYIDYNWVD